MSMARILIYLKITVMNNQSYTDVPLNRYMSHSPSRIIQPKSSSAEEYSRNKIGQLQEEVNKLKRELAQRECVWGKEKSQLLNKAQILGMQVAEAKQRVAQLTKVNLTLQMALTVKEEGEGKTARKDETLIRQVQQELSLKSKQVKQLKKINDQLKKKLIAVEDDRNRALEMKQQKIDALSTANKQLTIDQQSQMTALKLQLSSLPFNREIMSAIMRILNARISPDLTYEDLQQDEYCESPVTRRFTDYKNKPNRDSSFSRISSHSIISQLNTNQQRSQFSQEEEGQKLLCEVCRRVYEQRQFIEHMDGCNKTKLQQDRQKLQKDLRDLNEEHRKSLSQLKRKPTREMENPLHEISNNLNSSCRMLQKKASKVIKQPLQRPGNFSQLIGNDYRSSKYF